MVCARQHDYRSRISAPAYGGLRTACTWRQDNDSCEFATPELSALNLLLPLLVISSDSTTRPVDGYVGKVVVWQQISVNTKVEWQLESVSKVVPGSDGLEEYWERIDELSECQTLRLKFLHAARLRKMQTMTDLVNPLTEAEMLTDHIRDKLESDPPLDLTENAMDKPHTHPMSLMDSPSNMKLKNKYRAAPPSYPRPSSRMAVTLYSREEGKEESRDEAGTGIGMESNSLDRVSSPIECETSYPL